MTTGTEDNKKPIDDGSLVITPDECAAGLMNRRAAFLHDCALDLNDPINDWEEDIQQFINNEPRMADAIAIFAQKFTAIGENRNFALSTLADLSWVVLMITWESLAKNKLKSLRYGPLVETLRSQLERMREQLSECRTEYWKELTSLREQFRQFPPELEAIVNSVMSEKPVEPHYYFEPSDFSLNAKEREYINLTVQEKLKLALLKGADDSGLQDDIRRMNELKATLEQKDVKIQQLITQLETVQEQLRQAGQGSGNQRSGKEKQLEHELKQAMNKMGELADTVDKKDVQIQNLMSEANEKRALEFELAKMNEKMTDFQAALGDSKKTIEIKDGQLLEKSKLVEEHKREVSKMQAEINRLLKEGSKPSGASPAEITRLEGKITDLKDQLAAQENLQANLEAAAEKHKTARGKLASYAHAVQNKANYFEDIMEDVGVDVDYTDPIIENVEPATKKEVDSGELADVEKGFEKTHTTPPTPSGRDATPAVVEPSSPPPVKIDEPATVYYKPEFEEEESVMQQMPSISKEEPSVAEPSAVSAAASSQRTSPRTLQRSKTSAQVADEIRAAGTLFIHCSLASENIEPTSSENVQPINESSRKCTPTSSYVLFVVLLCYMIEVMLNSRRGRWL